MHTMLGFVKTGSFYVGADDAHREEGEYEVGAALCSCGELGVAERAPTRELYWDRSNTQYHRAPSKKQLEKWEESDLHHVGILNERKSAMRRPRSVQVR